jgi:hypothetical protein
MEALDKGIEALAQALLDQEFRAINEFDSFVTFEREGDSLKIHVGPMGHLPHSMERTNWSQRVKVRRTCIEFSSRRPRSPRHVSFGARVDWQRSGRALGISSAVLTVAPLIASVSTPRC